MRILVFTIIFSFLGFQAQATVLAGQDKILILCEHPVMSSFGFIVTYNQYGKPQMQGKILGIDKTPQKVKHQSLKVIDAYKDYFVFQTANKIKVSWPQVAYVNKYIIGNVDDDMSGVVGVTYHNSLGQEIYRGMFFGWGGPTRCK